MFYFFNSIMYSVCFSIPYRTIIIWNDKRSIAHNLQFVIVFTDAVLVQLYKIANSPNTFPLLIKHTEFFPFITSMDPSEMIKLLLLGFELKLLSSPQATLCKIVSQSSKNENFMNLIMNIFSRDFSISRLFNNL
jgi:hypothetical protein